MERNGQIEQGDLARDYEGLPITAAAHRSRANTYNVQNQVLKDTYAALMSRGEVDASVRGRLNELQRSLDAAGRMTPDNMVKWQSLLLWARENEIIDQGQLEDAIGQMTAIGVATSGMSPFTSE